MSRSCVPLLDVSLPVPFARHTPSLPYHSLREQQPCNPRHGGLFGRMAELNTLAGYEPNDLIEMNNTEVTPIFFHRSCVTSTCDSAESIATPPPESDLDDEHMRDMMASLLYLQEGEASVDQPRVYHPTEKTLCEGRHVSE